MNDHENLQTHVTGQTNEQQTTINSDMRSSIVVGQQVTIQQQQIEVSPFEIQTQRTSQNVQNSRYEQQNEEMTVANTSQGDQQRQVQIENNNQSQLQRFIESIQGLRPQNRNSQTQASNAQQLNEGQNQNHRRQVSINVEEVDFNRLRLNNQEDSPEFQIADDYSVSRNDGSVIPPNALALQLNEGDIQSPPVRRLSEQYVYDRINQMGSVNQEVSAYGGSYTAHSNAIIGEENNSIQDNDEIVDYINNEVAQTNNGVTEDQQAVRLRMPERLSRIQRLVNARPRPQQIQSNAQERSSVVGSGLISRQQDQNTDSQQQQERRQGEPILPYTRPITRRQERREESSNPRTDERNFEVMEVALPQVAVEPVRQRASNNGGSSMQQQNESQRSRGINNTVSLIQSQNESQRQRRESRTSNQDQESILNTSRTVLQSMGQNSMQVVDAAQRYIQELERENQFLRQLQDQRSLLQQQQQERSGVNSSRRIQEGANGGNYGNNEVRPGETQPANSARHNFRPQRRQNQYDEIVQRLTAEMAHELRERDSDEDEDGGIKDFDTRLMLLNMHKQIPAVFHEELIVPSAANQVSIALLEYCGPITLLIFLRCLDLEKKYSEFKDMKQLKQIAKKCHEALKKGQEDNFDGMPFCTAFTKKMLEFFCFTLQMSRKDIMYQWKIQKFVGKIIPSLTELKMMLQDYQMKPSEMVMVKTLLEIHETYILKTQSPHFQELLKKVYPTMKLFYKRFTKTSKNDFKRHLKADNGDYEMLMTQVKILSDNSGKMVPKDMIILEEDPEDCLLILKEKKGRIKSYQGFSKKDLLKLDGKAEQKSTPQKSFQKKKISQNVHSIKQDRISEVIELEHTPRKENPAKQLQLFKSGETEKKKKIVKICKTKKEDVPTKQQSKPTSLHICPKAMRKAQKQMRIHQNNVYRSSRPELNQNRQHQSERKEKHDSIFSKKLIERYEKIEKVDLCSVFL